MAMQDTIQVLNSMVSDGVIDQYAISGAVASFYYIEVRSTEDLDVLVSLRAKSAGGLVLLTPITDYLGRKGYDRFVREGIEIEGWPVQFLPTASPLDDEALDAASSVELSLGRMSVQTRLLRAEHLVANAILLQRPQDQMRIAQFLDEDKVDRVALAAVLKRHRLLERWAQYCRMTGRDRTLGGNLPK